MHSGGNVDIVTQCECDFNDEAVQQDTLAYIGTCKPLVVVMAPTCKPNCSSNPDSWHRSCHDDVALDGKFCGHVARLQQAAMRFFICEQPHPSNLYAEEPWPESINRPDTISLVVHQCMAGLVGPQGLPQKKATGFVANHALLVFFLRGFVCDGTHLHEPAGAAQIWPWRLAQAVADGICALEKHVKHPILQSFPSIATSTESGDADAQPAEAWRGCPGCRGRMASTDPAHNRVAGICKHPFVEPVVWGCRGCAKRLPEGSFAHTYIPGECKFSSRSGRASAPRRRGKHPRPPAILETGTPAADLQAQLPDGTDLGAADEAEANATAASSSAAGNVRSGTNMKEEHSEDTGSAPGVTVAGSAPGNSSGSGPGGGQGSDTGSVPGVTVAGSAPGNSSGSDQEAVKGLTPDRYRVSPVQARPLATPLDRNQEVVEGLINNSVNGEHTLSQPQAHLSPVIGLASMSVPLSVRFAATILQLWFESFANYTCVGGMPAEPPCMPS